MKYIISGTDRKNSNTRQIAGIVQAIYSRLSEAVELIDLANLTFDQIQHGAYGQPLQGIWKNAVDQVNSSEGLIVVVPEYNGSMPGSLKYFIDQWKFPDCFENRPVCFIGLGGLFGGLRPVEHMQQILGYRNAYIFPNRVFLMNAKKLLQQGQISDPLVLDLLEKQAQGFQKFVRALRSEKLDAVSMMAAK